MNDLTITNTLGCANAADGLELNRLILLDECLSNSESYFVAECHRRLKKEQLAGVVSFADDVMRHDARGKIYHQGHLGIVYQSLSGIFTGRGTARRLKLLPDGTSLSDRTIQKIRAGERGWEYSARILETCGAAQCPSNAEQRRQWLDMWLGKLTRPLSHPGNLRYAFPFAKTIKPVSLPYPKIRFSERQLALDF